ncbi:MAG: hypothetical protein JSR09_04190 [Bacteroidetes bacterium]|nr:hypothetical protein [Bacteroidota bacterium]MBS1648886.1 hypothetical protein [Bacteroidota bacterium]
MKKQSFLKTPILALIAAITVLASCNKKFDEPPIPGNPNITANTTIKALKAMHSIGGYDNITTDIIISGIVVGNDKSGNLYKQICIQDATGGITVLLDASNVYAQYPVGRQIFIKCKGLWLSDYGKLIQLGMLDNSVPGNPKSTGIPATLFDNYIVKGSLGNVVTPKVVTIGQLNDTLQSTLIQINNVEYIASDTSRTYADTSAAKNSVNLTLSECSGAKVVTYTSGYANFAGLKPPKGNGSITCIYFIYRTTPELIIRDTSDVQLNGLRCAATATLLTISQLRSMYTGSNLTLGSYKIRGVVISDAANNNLSTGNMVIQNTGTTPSGIDLYFGSAANTAAFNIGDSIEVNISGGTLTSYNGMLEVSLASSALPSAALATGITVTPTPTTIAQLNSNIATIENTLIKIVSAVASGGTTYSGNQTLTDASGTVVLHTATAATFASATLPTSCSNWVGIPSRYTTNQFAIRNTSDVTSGTGCSTGGGSGGGGGSTGTGIALTTSPVVLDFNSIGSGLPQGVSVFTGATSTSFGTAGTFTSDPTATLNQWANVSAGFKNFASATGQNATTTTATQSTAANRALGVRQTSALGDPGASFVFQLNNTTGKTNLGMSFLLQSLDNSIGRTTVWTVDYATGDTPSSFTTIATSPSSISTSSTWGSTPVTVSFGSALNNISSKVWIRISTLSATTGGGSRPSTAIDDVNFTFN